MELCPLPCNVYALSHSFTSGNIGPCDSTPLIQTRDMQHNFVAEARRLGEYRVLLIHAHSLLPVCAAIHAIKPDESIDSRLQAPHAQVFGGFVGIRDIGRAFIGKHPFRLPVFQVVSW